MTAAGNTSTERTFCRNHELRVVATLDSLRLNAPARCPFLCYFLLGKQKKVD